MKPAAFEYHAPSSIDEVLSLLAEHGDTAKILAGGQSLIPAMNFRVAQPAILVDCNNIPNLSGISVVGDGDISVKTMTRQRSVERSSEVAEHAPLLSEAMPFIAHPQIRNRGTVGGSLVHADPASELPVIATALGARFLAQKQGEERWIEADDFFFTLFMTDLKPDEMLTEIVFPAMAPRTGWSFTEISRRHGDYAMMGVAATVTLDDSGTCTDATLVYLNAGDKPVKTMRAADVLVGSTVSEEAIAEAAETASQKEIDPMGSVHATILYQRHLARVLTVRALNTALARASQ